jgi:hypothetical protein
MSSDPCGGKERNRSPYMSKGHCGAKETNRSPPSPFICERTTVMEKRQIEAPSPDTSKDHCGGKETSRSSPVFRPSCSLIPDISNPVESVPIHVNLWGKNKNFT